MKAGAVESNSGPCDTAEPLAKSKSKTSWGTWLRWLKFNLVGGIGIGVQFITLFLLKSIFHFHYLAAAALAVEAAVVHNFVWHEQFTWAARVQGSWRSSFQRTSGAEAPSLSGALFAALKALRHPKTYLSSQGGKGHPKTCLPSQAGREFFSVAVMIRCAAACLRGPSLKRLLRFNLTTGGVSIVGNLTLMKVMVGYGHMNYLVANGIAIALCSVVNFAVSDRYVFEGEA
jgi:putative flippase GtrA